MCGINGFIDFRNKYGTDKLKSLVHEMNERIIYRGPNSEGLFVDKNIALGMRRLSIIDLSTGDQPIYNEDKTLAIVYNGEIYNFQELKNQLKDNHIFYTSTDTEVIVHAYEEWGMDAFEKLDGMFGIAIYDKKDESVLLVRDRMGEKPLHYFKNDDCFIFGSELKSLLSTGCINKQISTLGLNQFLQFSYIPAPATIYENVYKILPGHWMKVTASGSITEGVYWKLRPGERKEGLTYENARQHLYSLLKKSVSERIVSDVPIGAFLSGGVDSGTIVGMMSQVMDKPVETFTIGFNEKEYDERSRAQLVAGKHKTNHHEYVLDYIDVLNSIDEILSRLDEPFADPSVLPSYFVCKFAGEYVKVVLTGDAGDELFMGYSKYLIDYYSKKYNALPKVLRNLLKSIVNKKKDTSVLSRKIHKVIDNAEKSPYEQRLSLMSRGFNDGQRQELLKEQYYDCTATDIVKSKYDEYKDATELKRTQYTDLSIVLEGDMLPKMDRASMMNSIETRTPLLSKDIVDFAFNIPDAYKISGKQQKRILKDTFKSFLPKNFSKGTKTGFDVPLDYWFRNELKETVQKYLNKETIEHQGLFNWDMIEKLLDDHMSERKNYKIQIWELLVFQKWYFREIENVSY